MRSRFAIAIALAILSGCAPRPKPSVHARATPPSAASSAPLPVGRSDGGSAPDPVPRVVRRIVREQQSELDEMKRLVGIVGDSRGRARALAETNSLTEELRAIEAVLDHADSDGLDDSVTRLLRLDSKIELLHEALRVANPEPGTPKSID